MADLSKKEQAAIKRLEAARLEAEAQIEEDAREVEVLLFNEDGTTSIRKTTVGAAKAMRPINASVSTEGKDAPASQPGTKKGKAMSFLRKHW